ncbi:MAG: hypothetical protein EPO35_04565 [Acidobacteria bacterium]|nr:MAG: hypothetical protein EPO35_04565 [Acidobacteriota bacterium]
MRTVGLLAAVAVASATIALSARPAGTGGAQRVDTSLPAVLARATEYLHDYRDKLTYVMATERSKQTLVGGFAAGGQAEETLASDVYFVYIPADKVWMAVRDVEIVDGKTLKERDNVRELLSSGQVGAARALKDRNARYNLGTILRNFNEPTLSLLVLDDQHRRRFTFVKQNARGNSVIVSFVERETPTLIIDTGGRPAYSSGQLTIDAATGRIERATLRVRLSGGIDAMLTTTYRLEKKLEMWVPARFEESYTLGGRRPEKITSESVYSDYSRFDVSVRIK